jgi:excinuclease UvrABC helicase subunit UvrB
MGFKLLPPKDVILMSLDELRLYRNDAEGARTKFYIKSAVVEVTAKNMKKMEKEMEDFNLLLDYISYLNFLLKSKLQNNS